MRHRISSVIGVLAPYVVAATLAVVAAALALNLFHADVHVPLYFGNDATAVAAFVKNIVEHGHVFLNPQLGAPGVQDSADFPSPHALHIAMLRLLSVFIPDYVVVLNTFFVLTFPLCAISSLYVLRRLGVSTPLAIAAALIYTFVPFHLLRGETHLFLSAYYVVPLVVWVAILICEGEVRPTTGSARGRLLFSTAVCALAASDNPYVAFFSAYLFAAAGLLGYFRNGNRRSLFASAALIGVLVLVFALNTAPTIIYAARHGRNPDVAVRSPNESERFGLRIAQLVLPVTDHRAAVLDAVKREYNVHALAFNESDSAALGAVGAGGFLYLLFVVLFRRPEQVPDRIHNLAVLNLSAVLLATIGGFGSMFALLVSPAIRSYNRISIFIAFFSIAALALAAEKLTSGVSIPCYRRYGYALALAALALVDQTPSSFPLDHTQQTTAWHNDADFFAAVEKSAPAGAMVFQLPYVKYPEYPRRHHMQDYDHERGFLHSKTLRWSYGAMRGRAVDRWIENVARQDPATMVDTLIYAGFEGIYLDRCGYADGARDLERTLAAVAETQPVVSGNGRLAYYSLANRAAALRQASSSAVWAAKRMAIMNGLESSSN